MGTITVTGTGATAEVAGKTKNDGAEITVVVAATVAAIVHAMETDTKATVQEDAVMVADDAVDMATLISDAEPVVARVITVVVTTTITTIMKSVTTKTGDYTAGHMGIAPINPMNATLQPMDKKARQR